MTRTILEITGTDRTSFLQGLVSNDVSKPGLIYAAILTPQGKYLADFFLLDEGDCFLLDVASVLADDLIKRLSMYRLRADVQIVSTGRSVGRGTGAMPQGAHPDPRHEALGWRDYTGNASEAVDWDRLRVTHCIPETGVELIPNDTFILEAGFERLHGVDFRKGCYVGQEVTARMKHKTDLRKGLASVEIDGHAPVGTQITANGKAAGTLFTQSGDGAIAYLRFDRAKGDMQAGDAIIRTLA